MKKSFHYVSVMALTVSMAAIPALATNLGQEYDENGKELIHTGQDTDSGFKNTYASVTRERVKSGNIDISGLFEWDGDVCYFNDLNTYTYINDMCCSYDSESGLYKECTDINSDTGLCDSGVLTTVYCYENIGKRLQVRAYLN